MEQVLREEYLNKLWKLKDLQLIKVVTGIRRCGKSVLLQQFQNRLRESGVAEEQIVALNFEELEHEDLLDRKRLYQWLSSRIVPGRKTYIFLDEIQKVDEFEKVVDSLHVKPQVDIYVTGSNAFLLSGELATFLSGRYVEINLLPLSFREYREFLGGENVDGLLSDYLQFGGMPYAACLRKHGIDASREYTDGIYNTVFVKDIEARQRRREPNPSKRKINDLTLLKNIAQYLMGVIGSPVSLKRIADYLTSAGRKTSHVTVADYVAALEETYLFYRVNRFDLVGKMLLKQNQKYYLVDPCFRMCALPRRNYDLGFSLENVVCLELLRRGFDVTIGKAGTGEVDFVAKKEGRLKYYQVTASMLEQSTSERELRPLQRIADSYPKTVLTADRISVGDCNGIAICNIADWLLASTND